MVIPLLEDVAEDPDKTSKLSFTFLNFATRIHQIIINFNFHFFRDGSSDEDDDDGARGSNDSGSGFGSKDEPEIEPEIGKVVCVELSGDKKKKDNWFPGLIVSPNAQDTNKINVHEEYLVRSFRDSRL